MTPTVVPPGAIDNDIDGSGYDREDLPVLVGRLRLLQTIAYTTLMDFSSGLGNFSNRARRAQRERSLRLRSAD